MRPSAQLSGVKLQGHLADLRSRLSDRRANIMLMQWLNDRLITLPREVHPTIQELAHRLLEAPH